MNTGKSLLLQSKERLEKIIEEHDLMDAEISVLAKPLTPEEAIGTPGRRDFPIIEGKERMIEAQVLGAKGQSFTDSPGDFIGRLADVMELPLTDNKNRAIFVAAMNAVLRYLNLVSGTVHCKDMEPEKCAPEIADYIFSKYGKIKVGLVGLNPAIAEALVEKFGAKNIFNTDLNRENIGKKKFGITILDGRTDTEKLVKNSELVLITGTTIVNGTIDYIMELVEKYGRKYIIYGVTSAGVCQLLGLNRICPFARDE
ncbi:hypothetical protein J7M00_05415 [bacterium]|nr:hypothetical protein [bacterium]